MQKAREQIARDWANLRGHDRTQCLQPEFYLPELSEWLTFSRDGKET